MQAHVGPQLFLDTCVSLTWTPHAPPHLPPPTFSPYSLASPGARATGGGPTKGGRPAPAAPTAALPALGPKGKIDMQAAIANADAYASAFGPDAPVPPPPPVAPAEGGEGEAGEASESGPALVARLRRCVTHYLLGYTGSV